MKYSVRIAENGIELDTFNTINECKDFIELMENEDKYTMQFEPNYYEIYNNVNRDII
jgi:hypothetical protein